MSSVELPMTDLTRGILRRAYQGMRWARLVLRAAVLLGLPLLVAYVLTAPRLSPEARTSVGTVVLAALGLAAVIVLFLTWSHARDERAIRLDLRSSNSYARRALACITWATTTAGAFDLHSTSKRCARRGVARSHRSKAPRTRPSSHSICPCGVCDN